MFAFLARLWRRYHTMITPEQLKLIATTLTLDRCRVIAELLNELSGTHDLKGEPFKMFLANVVQESGEFKHKSENMNYSSASRIQAIWPSRFPTVQSALPYVRNPEGLANKVYADRMGNNLPGDGWAYRGAGFIGLTGRSMYTAYAAYIGYSVSITADMVRTLDRYALDSAFWFYCVHKQLHKVTDFVRVVKGINGGDIGLDVRLRYYERCKRYL